MGHRQVEFALVVSAPKVIGVRTGGKHSALGFVAHSLPALFDEAVPIQDSADGALPSRDAYAARQAPD
jgi:hypothetical protein